jgi:hypothetical protein
VGYKFSLVLSREITDDESAILQEVGCSAAIFGTDSLPTNAAVTVTKMDFDDTLSPSLAEAIESALEAVKKVPDLTVPGLTVPAQPAGPLDETPKVVAGEVVEEAAPEGAAPEGAAPEEAAPEAPAAEEKKPAVKRAPARRTTTRKTSTRKKVEVSAEAE